MLDALAARMRLAGMIAHREPGHAGSLQTARGWLEEEGDNMVASLCLSRPRVALLHAPPERRICGSCTFTIGARLLAKGLADGDTRSAAAGCAAGGLYGCVQGMMPANMRLAGRGTLLET